MSYKIKQLGGSDSCLFWRAQLTTVDNGEGGGKEWELTTAQNAGSVCKVFQTSRCRELYNFFHHVEIAVKYLKNSNVPSSG